MGLVTRTAPAGAAAGFAEAWAAALDDLELEVDRAEALLQAEHARAVDPATLAADLLAPWTPPTLRHPLPADLRERAERLLERQLAVAGRLATAMTSSRRHLDVVDRLTPSDPRPMYVDQAM